MRFYKKLWILSFAVHIVISKVIRIIMSVVMFIGEFLIALGILVTNKVVEFIMCGEVKNYRIYKLIVIVCFCGSSYD